MMRRITIIVLLFLVIVFTGIQQSYALSFTNNVTVYDGKYSTATYAGQQWYLQNEDQEVEPGMIGAQSWDLEGFFLNGSELTMVGGYNFFQGNDNFLSGDIFIDVDGILNPANNSGNSSVNTAFGYDYVIDLDFTPNNYRYRVIELTGSVYTQPVYYSQNVLGNPWAYVSGGTEVSGWQSLNYATGLTNAQTEFLGGNHYALDVDLGFLSGINHKIGLHYTMQCGNDNLMGEYTPVPEPGTFALLGVGLLGLIAIRRKK